MKDLSLHLLDILTNSVSAGAKDIDINVRDSLKDNVYAFEIRDNGCGIREDDLARVTDAFFTSRKQRKVGLGLALVKMRAEQCGGVLEIESVVGKGTKVFYSFQHDNIDRPPLGDVSDALVVACLMRDDLSIRYEHKTDEGVYVFDSSEVKRVLQDVPIDNFKVMRSIKEMINNNLIEILVNE